MSSDSSGHSVHRLGAVRRGKTTLVEQLVEQTPHLKMSRSYTSRIAQARRHDGVDYNFVTRQRFETMVDVERVSRVGRCVRQPLWNVGV